MNPESIKEKREQERGNWIKNSFGSIENFLKQVFELRNEKPLVIRSRLKIPRQLWVEDRAIRQLREDAVKYMTKQELKKNPNLSSDDLWDKWELGEIPKWTKKGRVTKIRGYEDIFKEAKKELVKQKTEK